MNGHCSKWIIPVLFRNLDWYFKMFSTNILQSPVISQGTLQISSNCELRKSVAFFHNITPFASATHLNTVDITYYNSAKLMCKTNCSKQRKHTSEILILTSSLVSARGEWGHLHINCPPWVTCAPRGGQVMTRTLPHPDASRLPSNIQWCWWKVKFSATKLPLCTCHIATRTEQALAVLYKAHNRHEQHHLPLISVVQSPAQLNELRDGNAVRNDAMQTAHFPLDGNQGNKSSLVLYKGKL